MTRHDANSVIGDDSDVQRQRQIELHCTDFEKQWIAGDPILIEHLVDQVDERIRSELVGELVAIECELTALSSPSLEVFVERLPNWRQEVERGFSIWQEQCADQPTAPGFSPEPRTALRVKLGDYKILREIGRGGMGTVFEAQQCSLDRRVAIKTLAHSNVESLATRFDREARAVARLHHTNIIEVFGSGIDDGVPYIAMQLVDGRGLNELIHAAKNSTSLENPLTGQTRFQFVAKTGMQVASALEHAHENGVLHRDIKPSNLLIDENQNAWVSDFGLAKLRNDDSDATVAGSIVGTLRFLPPESFQGHWDERSDVYSLGLTLYELITLQPAFDASDQKQLLKQIVHGKETKTTRTAVPTTPLDLDTIILKATAYDPAARYQTAGLLATDLQRFIRGEPVHARRAGVVEKAWKWSKRNPALATLVATIAAVVTIGFPAMAVLWRRAEIARGEASDARMATEATSYGVSMLLAQKHQENGESYEMQRMLMQWEPSESVSFDRRDWEWQFLSERATGAELTMADEMPYAWSVTIRPDDRQIASIHGTVLRATEVYPVICLWNARTGLLERKLQDRSSRMFGLAYSPDGKQLATIGMNLGETNRGTLVLWDCETGARIKTTKLSGVFKQKHINGFYGIRYFPQVRFSTDGKWLLTGPEPCELLDAKTLKPVWDHTVRGRAVSFLGDEKILGHADNKFFVYSLNKGEQLQRNNFAANANHLHSSADGSVFSMAAKDDLKIIRASDLSVVYHVDQPQAGWCRISGDGKSLAYGDRDGAVSIKQLDAPGPATKFLGHETTVTGGMFSHDGRWLATSSLDGTVKKWDISSMRSSKTLNTRSGHTCEIAFAPDGKSILFTGQSRGDSPQTGSVQLTGGTATRKSIESTSVTVWPRHDFAFNPDGTMLAAPAKEAEFVNEIGYASSGKVTIWETNKWSPLQTLEIGEEYVTCTAWNEDGSLLLVGTAKEATDDLITLHATVRVYDVANKFKLLGETEFEGMPVSIAAVGENIAIGCEDSFRLMRFKIDPDRRDQAIAMVFDLKHRIATPGIPVHLNYSPTGDRVVVAQNPQDVFVVYDSVSGKELVTGRAPREVRSVCYSPNGNRIAVVGNESHVYLCDAASGKQLLELKGRSLRAGTNPNNASVKFSPDGKRIAVNAIEGKIKVWEIKGEIPEPVGQTK